MTVKSQLGEDQKRAFQRLCTIKTPDELLEKSGPGRRAKATETSLHKRLNSLNYPSNAAAVRRFCLAKQAREREAF